jgi:hypothetical protein
LSTRKKKDDGVTLKIANCLQCPNHGIERDPSSGDSFDWGDSSLVCYAANGKDVVSRSDLGNYVWKAPARRICSYSRNPAHEYKHDGAKIPNWCPLRKGGKP